MEYIRPNGFVVSRHWVCKSPEIYRKDGTLSCKRFCLWPLSLIGVQTGYGVSIGHSILFTLFSQIIEGLLVLCGVEYFFLSWKRPQWQGQRIKVIIDINFILICNKPWFCVHLTPWWGFTKFKFPPTTQQNMFLDCKCEKYASILSTLFSTTLSLLIEVKFTAHSY